MERSQDIDELAKALCAVQDDIGNLPARRTADTGKFSYHYASLPDILTDIRPALAKHDLNVVQEVSSVTGYVGVATLVIHASGQYLRLGSVMLPAGETAQDAGGVITYLRRHSLLAALNLSTADDDAQQASTGATRAASGGNATKRQLGKIRADYAALGLEASLEAAVAKRFNCTPEDLTTRQASELIDLIAEFAAQRSAKAQAAGADPTTGEVAATEGVEFAPEDDDVPGMDAAAYAAAKDDGASDGQLC